jgi:hypothetical protein
MISDDRPRASSWKSLLIKEMIFRLEAGFDRQALEVINTGGQRPPLNRDVFF